LLYSDPVGRLLNYGARVDFHPDAPTAQAIEEGLFWPALSADGNGYAEIQRDGAGNPIALWPIEPGRVTPKRVEGFYGYEVIQATGGTVFMDPMSIFHLRGPSLLGWVGDSTIYRAGKSVGISQAAQVFAASYFANGTVISGLLTSDKVVTPDQAKRAKTQWTEDHGRGPGQAHGIGVLGAGIKYQPLNHNAQEAQIVESRRFQVAEIARFFGVPLSLLAENEAWTNLSELYQGFVRNAVLPWASRFDAEATRKLFPQRAPWREIEHDLTQLRMGSFKDQVASLDQAVEGGLITRNEGRTILGQNTIGKEGDVLVVRAAVKRLEDALKPPAPPPAAVPSKPDTDEDEEEDSEESPTPMPRRRMAEMLAAHHRRFAARTKDLRAKGASESQVAEHVAALRSRALTDMRSVMAGLDEVTARAALEAVEHGVDASKAALPLEVSA